MKKLFLFLAAGLLFAFAAYAQSTATPAQLGFLTTSGCPGSQLSCYLPYSIANPLPAISN